MSVTAVITAYNRSAMLREAISSVLTQSAPADEIIVVDDGSTDGTAEMVHAEYPQVRLLEQANAGVAVARNTGVAAATSDWVAFLDDDDQWASDKLERLAPLLADPGCGAIHHPAREFDERGPGRLIHDAPVTDESLLLKVPSVPSAVVVRRDLTIRAGCFPTDLRFGEDYAFALNVARLAQWTFAPDALSLYRINHTRMTSDDSAAADVLAALTVRIWYSGQPLPGLATPETRRARLLELGPTYRSMYRPQFHAMLRRRRWRQAAAFWRVMRLVIPDRAQRLMLLPPEQLLVLLRRSR